MILEQKKKLCVHVKNTSGTVFEHPRNDDGDGDGNGDVWHTTTTFGNARAFDDRQGEREIVENENFATVNRDDKNGFVKNKYRKISRNGLNYTAAHLY